jgi:hypothetical protein
MDILVLLAIVGFLLLVGLGIWLVRSDKGPSGIIGELAGVIGMELLGLAAIVFFVGGALLVILLTGGGPAVGLLSIPVIVVIAGIILWRFRH